MSGGPAFPHHRIYCNGAYDSSNPEHGMTLRDYFAGQALAGLTGSAFRYLSQAETDGPLTEEAYRMLREIGETAYELADAMLAHRAKKEEGDG